MMPAGIDVFLLDASSIASLQRRSGLGALLLSLWSLFVLRGDFRTLTDATIRCNPPFRVGFSTQVNIVTVGLACLLGVWQYSQGACELK